MKTKTPLVGALVEIKYTNWKGKTSYRTIKPIELIFDSNQYHPKPCYLLRAFDIDKDDERTFAVQNIHSWKEIKPKKSARFRFMNDVDRIWRD